MNELRQNTEPPYDLSKLNLHNFADPRLGRERTLIAEGEKFVVFILDDSLFAVCARDVAEVVQPLPYTPLPASPPWLHGIANLRGEIVTVINLSRIFRKKTAPATSKNKLIILKSQNGGSAVSFPVDRLSEVITLTPGDIQPADDFRVIGKAPNHSGWISLLDTDQLFASL
jgi:purine-binding chemotaxis protein CheW